MHAADERFDFGGAIGKMALQPFEKEVFDLVREAEHDPACAGCAGISGGLEKGGDFAVVDSGQNGSGHDGDGNSGGGKFADGLKAIARAGGARFHFRGEFVVQACDADGNMDGAMSVEFAEQVEIAQDEFVFGDDADGLAAFDHDFKATTRDAEFSFDWLIAIGHAGHGDCFASPAFLCEFAAEEGGGIVFGEDDGFEVEAAGHSEIFVAWARIAVNAAVFAASVGIDCPFHREVGGIDWVDEGLGLVGEDFGLDLRAVWVFGADFIEVFVENVEANGFEAIAGIEGSASASGWAAGESVSGGEIGGWVWRANRTAVWAVVWNMSWPGVRLAG